MILFLKIITQFIFISPKMMIWPTSKIFFNVKTKYFFLQAATIAKELLNAGTSPTADAIAKKSVSNSSPSLPPHLPQLPTSGKNWDKTPGLSNHHYMSSLFTAGQGVSPKEQLAYLSQVLGFTVTYTDFPKKGEYLSLVSLSTTPAQVRSYILAGKCP